MSSTLRRAALLLLLAAPFAGCKQGIGERCQVTADCQGGLICVLPAQVGALQGGSCQLPGGGDAGEPDLSIVDSNPAG